MAGRVQIVVHVAGPGTVRQFQGRPHRVVPATLVKSQILQNNLGRTYLPPAAITAKWAGIANGSPVVVDHPKSRGMPVSARDPSVANSMGVGTLYEVLADNGRLTGEVWLDLSRADAVPDLKVILTRLDEGKPVELSTGFPVSVDESPGAINGAKYDRVIYPIGFDHLAVFANQTGACSVKDGCGLAANADPDEQHWTFVLNDAADPPTAERDEQWHEFLTAAMTDTDNTETPMDAENETAVDEPRGRVAQIVTNLMAELRKLVPQETEDTPAEGEAVTEPAANDAGDHTETGETAMNREQMIAQLAAAGRKTEALNALQDCDLRALLAANGQSQNTVTQDDPEEVAILQQRIVELRRQKDELEQSTATALQAEKREKQTLIEELIYNGNTQFADTEIRAMGIDQLRKLHGTVFNARRASYIGRGGPQAGNSADLSWVKPVFEKEAH